MLLLAFVPFSPEATLPLLFSLCLQLLFCQHFLAVCDLCVAAALVAACCCLLLLLLLSVGALCAASLSLLLLLRCCRAPPAAGSKPGGAAEQVQQKQKLTADKKQMHLEKGSSKQDKQSPNKKTHQQAKQNRQ